MANYVNTEHSSVRIALGDNEFRTGVITLAAGVTAKAGTIVKTVSGKFVAATGADDETGLGVIVEDETNSGSASADIPTRVLISGKVNEKALLLSGTAATTAQADALRQWAIVPVVVNEFGRNE